MKLEWRDGEMGEKVTGMRENLVEKKAVEGKKEGKKEENIHYQNNGIFLYGAGLGVTNQTGFSNPTHDAQVVFGLAYFLSFSIGYLTIKPQGPPTLMSTRQRRDCYK